MTLKKYSVVVTLTETYEVMAESEDAACEMEVAGDAGEPVESEVQDRTAEEVKS